MYTESEIKQLISSGETHKFYKDYYWRSLALKVIAENHKECYQCRLQGKYTRAKLAHHVKPLKDYPELAYCRVYSDEEGEHIQLMPLCHNCHEKIHERGAYFQQKGFKNEEKW